MNPSEPFSPRGHAAASGFDPMPGAFTGQARDLPAPFEFPSIPAARLLAPAPPPALAPALASRTENATGPAPPERPMVPVETAFRLQELATALARPPRPDAPVPTAPAPAAFSLTALADQLQSRFTQPDPHGDGGLDLLAAAAPAKLLGTRPATAPAIPVTAPRPAALVDAATGLAALLPSLVTNPATAIPPPSTEPAAPVLPEKPAAAMKPAMARQGDVFFMEPPVSRRQPEAPVTVEDLDPSEGLPGLPGLPGLMDLMDAPALPETAAPRPLPPHQAEPFLPRPLTTAPAPEALVPPAESGPGLVLGGSGLILLGIYFACQLPLDWLNLEDGTAWEQQKTLAALVLHATAAGTALTLGTGSVMLRRWAPPLIHAAGWVAALTASGIIAVTGFHLVNADADTALPGTASLVGLLAALLIPLACIFYYQQESATDACEAADPAPAWTDGQPVPALMVFLTGLAIAAGAGAMLCHRPAFPLVLESPLTGPAATAAWGLLGLLGLGSAAAAWLKHAAALWLLVLAALALAATLSPAALTDAPAWRQFLTSLGAPDSPVPPVSLIPLLSALIPAPLLLVFAMARRAFPSPPTT
jgi:hypothetical protein